MMTALLVSLLGAGPILEAPTAKRIAAVLERKVTFLSGDNEITLGPKSKASASGPFGAKGTGRYGVQGDRVSISGDGTQACMGDADTCAGQGSTSWSFSATLLVMGVGDGRLLVRIENDSSTMARPSNEPLLLGTEDEPDVVVQLVRAAKDEALAVATERTLTEWKDEASKRYLFFRGPKAVNPRTVSEIFFGEGAEDEAKEVATRLTPTLGPAKVKPWPGKAPADVIVVVGSAKAE